MSSIKSHPTSDLKASFKVREYSLREYYNTLLV
jgi:hypothetical protein